MRRTRPGADLAGVTLALLLPALPAAAQNNSLFSGNQRQGGPATSQPAYRSDPVPVGVRSTLAAERPETKPNAVLLHLSPMAVSKPEPLKIKVHDLLTIIVRESKTATTDSKLQSKKDWKVDTILDKWVRLTDENRLVPAKFEAGKPAAAFNLKNDYKGDGKYDRRDELTTRITARVIDVKPNGNLVLEATKQIAVDDEGYLITLTGECRSRDVTADNTVLSTQIADPEIIVQHSGAVRDATRRGWLMRGLDLLRAF